MAVDAFQVFFLKSDIVAGWELLWHYFHMCCRLLIDNFVLSPKCLSLSTYLYICSSVCLTGPVWWSAHCLPSQVFVGKFQDGRQHCRW